MNNINNNKYYTVTINGIGVFEIVAPSPKESLVFALKKKGLTADIERVTKEHSMNCGACVVSVNNYSKSVNYYSVCNIRPLNNKTSKPKLAKVLFMCGDDGDDSYNVYYIEYINITKDKLEWYLRAGIAMSDANFSSTRNRVAYLIENFGYSKQEAESIVRGIGNISEDPLTAIEEVISFLARQGKVRMRYGSYDENTNYDIEIEHA